MQVRQTEHGWAEIYPPLRPIRARSVGFDTSHDDAPRLIYIYAEGKTQSPQTDRFIDVHWDSGGLSRIANDHNVTWLDE